MGNFSRLWTYGEHLVRIPVFFTIRTQPGTRGSVDTPLFTAGDDELMTTCPIKEGGV